jgi:hypothetical protein
LSEDARFRLLPTYPVSSRLSSRLSSANESSCNDSLVSAEDSVVGGGSVVRIESDLEEKKDLLRRFWRSALLGVEGLGVLGFWGCLWVLGGSRGRG